jgi:hypothetical protein
MAMSDDTVVPESREPTDDLLDRAAGTLREITDDGWIRARESVLARVLRTVRPSRQIAGRHEHAAFTVTSDLLADQVRATVDAAVPEARTIDVRCAVGPDDELESVVVVLSVRYGERIADAADTARVVTARAVERTLGTAFRPRDVAVDLHVADVHRPGKDMRSDPPAP